MLHRSTVVILSLFGLVLAPQVSPLFGTEDARPAELELVLTSPMPGQADADNTVTAAGVDDGDVVYFIFGTEEGTTGMPGCATDLEIGAASVVGTAVAGETGEAAVSFFMPAAARGRQTYLQAVEQSTCRVSNLVSFEFL